MITSRLLLPSDWRQYLDLMFEFTRYPYDLSREEFEQRLDEPGFVIIVLLDHDKLIGAGSLFVLRKLHNNPVGQIEDVVITKDYRNRGLGRRLVNELVDLGLQKMACYKIILNCIDDNVVFYQKCGFKKAGCEMKYTR